MSNEKPHRPNRCAQLVIQGNCRYDACAGSRFCYTHTIITITTAEMRRVWEKMETNTKRTLILRPALDRRPDGNVVNGA